ncbi:MAG: hypothetical protein IT379_12755 [Deltaproteobacteria bacterium]|nr:hypothetical protein [Deltaproteobacteria bacterium]
MGLLGAPPASAQPAPSEAQTRQARTLFREGLSHADAGRWSAAAERFRRALALRAAPPIRYNLAAALVELGDPVEAAEHLDLVLADAETAQDVRTQAMQLLSTVSARTGRITLRLTGAPELVTGVTIRVDDRALPAGPPERSVRVMPGPHVAVAMRDGRQVGRGEATVAAGETVALSIALVPTPAEAASAATAQGSTGDPRHTQDRSSDDDTNWPLIVGIGVGAAAVLTGIIVVAVVGARGVADPVSGDLDPAVLRVGR